MTKTTKPQVIKWLEEKQEKYQGQYMNAEERDDDEAMQRAEEKEENIEEILTLLDNIT